MRPTSRLLLPLLAAAALCLASPHVDAHPNGPASVSAPALHVDVAPAVPVYSMHLAPAAAPTSFAKVLALDTGTVFDAPTAVIDVCSSVCVFGEEEAMPAPRVEPLTSPSPYLGSFDLTVVEAKCQRGPILVC